MEVVLDTSIERLFASVIGLPLTALARNQYVFNGEPCPDDAGSLQLHFETTTITLKLVGDGQSVTAVNKPIELTPPFSLASDSHCAWSIVDLFGSAPWSHLANQPLRAVDGIIGTWPDNDGAYIMGWLFSFDRHHFCYINWGDNSRILFDESPPFEHCDKIQTSTLPIARA
jgi:hypothetical protein